MGLPGLVRVWLKPGSLQSTPRHVMQPTRQPPYPYNHRATFGQDPKTHSIPTYISCTLCWKSKQCRFMREESRGKSAGEFQGPAFPGELSAFMNLFDWGVCRVLLCVLCWVRLEASYCSNIEAEALKSTSFDSSRSDESNGTVVIALAPILQTPISLFTLRSSVVLYSYSNNSTHLRQQMNTIKRDSMHLAGMCGRRISATFPMEQQSCCFGSGQRSTTVGRMLTTWSKLQSWLKWVDEVSEKFEHNGGKLLSYLWIERGGI